MQSRHADMQGMQVASHPLQGMLSGRRLLNADQVRQLLHIDRSTVYRMAESGRLPATKVGRQWRFPAEQIEQMTQAGDRAAGPVPSRQELLGSLQAGLPLIEVSAQLLGVMMVVTDMAGEPVTDVINPCPWFSEHADDTDLLSACLADWKELADDPDFDLRFRTMRSLGFDCARAFIRVGPQLIGMLAAGGIATADDDPRGLYRLDGERQALVLSALPLIAARVSRLAAAPADGFEARRMA